MEVTLMLNVGIQFNYVQNTVENATDESLQKYIVQPTMISLSK